LFMRDKPLTELGSLSSFLFPIRCSFPAECLYFVYSPERAIFEKISQKSFGDRESNAHSSSVSADSAMYTSE
ncbi:hypothetical protein, partial [Faecalibaculum rodentium]